MCIIVAKTAKIDMPTMDTLRECFKSNPDGFGIAYSDGDKVHIRKGAMTKTAMETVFDELPDLKPRHVIMHFRRATTGKVSPENCHPYPLSKKTHFVKHTNVICQMAVAHNGIINFEKVKSGGLTAENTDTQEFIMQYLSNISSQLLNPTIQLFISHALSSKFALLSPTKISLLGDFTEDNEVFYSNSSYKKTVVVTYQWQGQGGVQQQWQGRGYDYDDDYAGAIKSMNDNLNKVKPVRQPLLPLMTLHKEAKYCQVCGSLVHCLVSAKVEGADMQMCYHCYNSLLARKKEREEGTNVRTTAAP